MSFWNKKPQTKNESTNKHIQVIPDEFYGGKDPVIYPVNNTKKNTSAGLPPPRISLDPNLGGKLVNLFGNKIFRIVILSILSVVALVIISFYYLNQAGYKILNKQPVVKEEGIQPTITESTSTVPTTDYLVAQSSTTTESVSNNLSEVVTTTEIKVEEKYSFDNQTIDFPKIILADSPDSDSDALTDEEEMIFGTDPQKWDTDSDGYYDGQEVNNLYNPKGLAPVKIIDSGLVREYVSPNWQYRLYYPAIWQIGTVDKEGHQVLFSSAQGDYFEVLTYNLLPDENFTTWFSKKAVGQEYTDLTSFNNRFKENGFKRRDGLVYYFVSNNKVLVLLFHTLSTSNITYRNVFNMVAQSFRVSKSEVVIPEQTVLPEVPPVTP